MLLESFPNPKIILTNANEEERIKFGIISMPYQVFSCDHHPDKINPIFYQKLLERYSLSPEETLYFEHNIDHVNSALSIGIQAEHYDKDRKDIESLKKFLQANL